MGIYASWDNWCTCFILHPKLRHRHINVLIGCVDGMAGDMIFLHVITQKLQNV